VLIEDLIEGNKMRMKNGASRRVSIARVCVGLAEPLNPTRESSILALTAQLTTAKPSRVLCQGFARVLPPSDTVCQPRNAPAGSRWWRQPKVVLEKKNLPTDS